MRAAARNPKGGAPLLQQRGMRTFKKQEMSFSATQPLFLLGDRQPSGRAKIIRHTPHVNRAARIG